MAWISVDQKMVGGKLRKLYKAIGCSQNEAMGMLVGLWLWGIDNADADGLIVSAEREDIADVLMPDEARRSIMARSRRQWHSSLMRSMASSE